MRWTGTPRYNQFKYRDRPLATSDNVPRLREVWEQYDQETNDSGLWGLDKFEAEVV